MGQLGKQEAVLAAGRLAFGSVADDEPRATTCRHCAHLPGHGEGGAASSPQTRSFDLVDQAIGRPATKLEVRSREREMRPQIAVRDRVHSRKDAGQEAHPDPRGATVTVPAAVPGPGAIRR